MHIVIQDREFFFNHSKKEKTMLTRFTKEQYTNWYNELKERFEEWTAGDGGLTYAATDALAHLWEVYDHCMKAGTFCGSCLAIEENGFACCECEPWEWDICSKFLYGDD